MGAGSFKAGYHSTCQETYHMPREKKKAPMVWYLDQGNLFITTAFTLLKEHLHIFKTHRNTTVHSDCIISSPSHPDSSLPVTSQVTWLHQGKTITLIKNACKAQDGPCFTEHSLYVQLFQNCEKNGFWVLVVLKHHDLTGKFIQRID